MKTPTTEQIETAKREIAEEDARARRMSAKDEAVVAETRRRSQLPSEHPEHIHGMMCDGQDGDNSYCARIRRKLFG